MNDTRYTAIAAALREEFPKANKGTVSMALHTNDYGVKFCARAQEIYDAVTQRKPRIPRRVKPIRLQCRLTESTAQRVKQALERNGIASMQTFLESLVRTLHRGNLLRRLRPEPPRPLPRAFNLQF